MGIVALIYRYGANQSKPKWRWTSPGVIVATVLWIGGSALFTVYVYHFGSYNKTYGALSVVLVMLSWMWMSVFVVLFGAEINGEAERQRGRTQRPSSAAGRPGRREDAITSDPGRHPAYRPDWAVPKRPLGRASPFRRP